MLHKIYRAILKFIFRIIYWRYFRKKKREVATAMMECHLDMEMYGVGFLEFSADKKGKYAGCRVIHPQDFYIKTTPRT